MRDSCALVDAHARALSKTASAPSCQLLAAWPISPRVFPVGQQAMFTHRSPHFAWPKSTTQRPSFTFFEARCINFAIVVYSVFVHVEVDLH
jgi:hypothetical protein